MPSRCSAHSATREYNGCPDCLAVKRADFLRRKQRKQDGTFVPLVDATPAREHIAALRSATGTPIYAIADAANLPRTTVYGVASGYVSETHQDILTAILSIPATDTRLFAPNIPIGLVRRAYALCAIGHGVGAQSIACGLSVTSGIARIINHRGNPRRETREAIHEMYERLRHEPPEQNGSTWVLNMARRCGWPTPDAWTDETIDDPYAEPIDPQCLVNMTEVNVVATRILSEEPVSKADLTKAERAAIVDKLVVEGMPLLSARVRAGISRSMYKRYRSQPVVQREPAGPLVIAVTGDQTATALRCGYQLYMGLIRAARGPGVRTILCPDQPGVARLAADIAKSTLRWNCQFVPQQHLVSAAAEMRDTTGAHATGLIVAAANAGAIWQRQFLADARAHDVPTEKIALVR